MVAAEIINLQLEAIIGFFFGQNHRWFHGNISTTEAERLLNPREDGMFLIRNSSTYKGDYALSVWYVCSLS